MSSVEAYICNNCFIIKSEEEIIGIIPTEDMFDTMSSFPSVSNPKKALVHYCINCYNNEVIEIAKQVNRKKNETEYKKKLKELSYSLRKKCVQNYRLKIFKK